MTDYTAQLESEHNWDNVKAEQLDMAIDQAFDLASFSFGEEVTDQGIVGMAFVGTVFNLTPSGKYYMPWANSNVEVCPECGGDGHARPKTGDVCSSCPMREHDCHDMWSGKDCIAQQSLSPIMQPCHICNGQGARLVSELAELRNETPMETMEFLASQNHAIISTDQGKKFECLLCKGKGEVYVDCPTCGGLGSAEAYQDSLWQEALDSVLDNHGMWSQSGEGDPCDIFFCRWVSWGEVFSHLLGKQIANVEDWLHDKATIRDVKSMTRDCKRFVSLYKRAIYG